MALAIICAMNIICRDRNYRSRYRDSIDTAYEKHLSLYLNLIGQTVTAMGITALVAYMLIASILEYL